MIRLDIRPAEEDLFPLGAVLIRGASAEGWLKELQSMGLSLSSFPVYPLPGTVANTVWGCVVVGSFDKSRLDIGRNAWCQIMHGCLLIPQRARLYPQLSAAEVQKLFKGKLHFMHPETGLVELEEAIIWNEVIEPPTIVSIDMTTPRPASFLPLQVRSFQVKPVAREEVLQSLEKDQPVEQEFEDKPLSFFEKIKLFFYRKLMKKAVQTESGEKDAKPGFFDQLLISIAGGIAKTFSPKGADWKKEMAKDYEELERRSQDHIDRLLDLLKSNPAEALKYALPLNGDGSGRGTGLASFRMERRWNQFSLFGRSRYERGGPAAVIATGAYTQLGDQYNSSAEDLIEKGLYEKAAFIYMKLLKDYDKAAKTLEDGKLYEKAAVVYLEYKKDKRRAAECYEKANMVERAIELYKELSHKEKVGDLYLSINKKKEAMSWYQQVLDGHVKGYHFMKAAELRRYKMEDEAGAQDLLLQGWRLNADAVNCLKTYLKNMGDQNELKTVVQNLYSSEVKANNRVVFLEAIRDEFGKSEEVSQLVRDIAYEIVAAEVKTNPEIITRLKTFNPANKELTKDTIRYKLNIKKKN